ncbi:hypothetical protein [Salinibaculum salinum]|uniref:hypothetical protein n=1 Tax=Salinibaculum salinum TaxID=3131996 RepID=UPI0030EEA1C1
MAVEWNLDGGDSGSSTGSTTLPLSITDTNAGGDPDVVAELVVSLPGSQNNPAYPWFRLECPGATGLAEDLEMAVTYSDGGTIAEGSLVSVANQLRNSAPLNPDGTVVSADQRDCLTPGETINLVLTANLPDWYVGEESLSVTFEFAAEQCRHNDGEASPYPERPACPDPPDEPANKAISFIAFCSGATDPNPEITDINAVDDDGDPTSVDWQTDADVRYVIVKTATYITIYDYSEETAQSGTAAPWDEDAFKTVEKGTGVYGPGDESTPCSVAERVVTDDTTEQFEGTQVTFEYEGGA